MRKIGCAACVAVLLCWAAQVRSGDEAALRGVVAKAIEARGGEAKLGRFQNVTFKGSGKFYGLGDEGIPYTGAWAISGPTRMKVVLEARVMDQTFKLVKVVNNDKAWKKLNEEAAEAADKEEVAEARQELYEGWVTMMMPLKDKEFKLAALGEVKVNDRPAVGVRVQKKGYRDVNLYFDKENHLLLKSEMVVKDEMSKKEVTQESFYSNYKELDGAKIPMTLTVKRDGKRYVDAELSDVKAADKLPDNLFDKP
jgi:hypothetical protein